MQSCLSQYDTSNFKLSRSYQVRNQTSSSNIPNSLLCRLRLLLTLNDRDERDMNLQEIPLPSASLQLSHGLNERRTLNITHRASKLDNTHIRLLIRIIDWDPRNTLNPILNCIREMRHHLDGLSEVIAPTFTLNYVLVDLPCCDVALTCQGDVEIALVVSEVEVDFSTVVEDKDFTVPGRTQLALSQTNPSALGYNYVLGGSHGSGIDVHVRIDLD